MKTVKTKIPPTYLYWGILFTSFSIVGCGVNKLTIQEQFDKSADAANIANSKSEWDASEFNPSSIFAKLRQLSPTQSPEEATLTSREVCNSLLSLTDQDLEIFESEINDDLNSKLVDQNCREEIAHRLNTYSKNQLAKIEIKQRTNSQYTWANNPRFADNIQARDTQNGYIARRGDVGKKEVVLTFDDGPSNLYTPKIQQALKDFNAKAIFFTLGKNVVANPEVLKSLAKDGHAIGSHSFTHPCLGSSFLCLRSNGRILSDTAVREEFVKGHKAILNVLGWADPFFRYPYGERSTYLSAWLKENHIGEFGWNIDSEDWRSISYQALVDSVIKQVETQKGGIILFHDIQRKTADTLPTILAELHKRGYSVVLLQPANPKYKTEYSFK